MPKNKDFKRLVRARAERNHETYTTARANLIGRPTTSTKQPVVCAVVGAGGRVAYNTLFRLASGNVFGPDTPVVLRLIDMQDALPGLEGS